jgi:cytochrome c-type biogenesis protein CcmE
MHNSKIDISNRQKKRRLKTYVFIPVVIALVATVGFSTLFNPMSTFALTFDMKNGDDDGDRTKGQGEAGGICKQVSPGHMTCTPILKYNGHCGIEDPDTMTSYEVECP